MAIFRLLHEEVFYIEYNFTYIATILLVQEPEDGHYKLAGTCSLKNTGWKTVIVMLDGIYPYITFMIIQNTTGMYHSNIKFKNKENFA
jgi:hypothetical protein